MNAPASPSGSRPLVIVFAVMLALALFCATRGWHATILDRHEFRQLQTAISAYWIKEAGFRLDYETPLFGPPWSIPMEFPVYQAIVGQLSARLGTGLEATGRAVSLAFFLAALPAVYGLAGLFGLTPARRLLVVAAVLASPTYLFYGRTLMIETTALCFSLWFLFAVARAVRDASVAWAALAAAAGALAALAKVTTFVAYGPPAGLLCLWLWRQRAAARRATLRCAALAAAPVASALAVGLWWVRHADRVKHSNPFSGFLTSTELAKWNWGTLEQRFSAPFWSEFWNNVSGFVLGEVALVALVLGVVVARAELRRIALVAAGFFVFAALLFSNLYFFHDYYYSANAALLLIGAGFALVGLWDDTRLPRAVRGVLLAVFFGGQLLVYHRGYADYFRRELSPPPAIADLLRATTPRDGVLLIYGWDWNATLPYFAARRALMVPSGREDDVAALEDLLRQLPPRKIAALVVRTDQLRQSPSFVRWRTDRLGLSPAPIATSDAGDVYLAEEIAADAARTLAGRSFPGVELNLASTAEPPFPAQQTVAAESVALPIFAPAPSAARTLYGMGAADVAGQPALNAHAPSELEFTAPSGARSIVATFGLPDAAWQGGPSVTDGIGVEIFERLPNGQRRTLHRRSLDPARHAADRGPQRVELRDAGPFRGVLIFRFTPGTNDNVVNDWAYWGSIEIR